MLSLLCTKLLYALRSVSGLSIPFCWSHLFMCQHQTVVMTEALKSSKASSISWLLLFIVFLALLTYLFFQMNFSIYLSRLMVKKKHNHLMMFCYKCIKFVSYLGRTDILVM